MRMIGVALLALIVASCAIAPQQTAMQAYRAQCIRQWGPEATWTPQQEQLFIEGTQRLAQQGSSGYRPINLPPPPVFTAPSSLAPPTYHAVPDGQGGYTIRGE